MGAPSLVTLSQRARIRLRELTEALPVSVGSNFFVVRSDSAPVRTWTFAGTRANRTLAHHASFGGQKVRFDAMSVYAPPSLLTNIEKPTLTLTDAEIALIAESIKFAKCVPQNLLTRTISTRFF